MAMTAVATISVASSLAVVLTPLLFPKMRGRLLMQIVAFISIGDILGNLPYVFPYRAMSDNWWCNIQGFLHLFGYPIEWMWTAALILRLYQLATDGKVPNRMWLLHLICWGIPLAQDLCMLTVAPYAIDNYNEGEVCTFAVNKRSFIYHNVCYFGLYLGCLFFMLVIYLRISALEHTQNKNVKKAPFIVAKNALAWYPTVLIIFWTPHVLVSMIAGNPVNFAYPFFSIWMICHGFATSFVFFYQSSESRRLWYIHVIYPLILLVRNRSCCPNIEGDEDSRILTRESDVSIVDLDDILEYDLENYTHSSPLQMSSTSSFHTENSNSHNLRQSSIQML